jgi:nicotinate-nucleotide pyrophosphorylase (carboxylating)
LHRIEIEVQAADQLERILKVPPDVVLIDNLGNKEIKDAIRLIDGRCEIEISGGITLERIPILAGLGVNYISVGKLTHSANNLDMSMDFFPEA